MRIPKRLTVLTVAGLTALLAVGTSVALAHGGFGLGVRNGKSPDALLAAAAKQLDVTTAKLKAAIVADAGKRIDAAVKAGDLDEDQAADLKDDIETQPLAGMRLTTATGVARELGTTKAKLDTAFRAARKAAMIAAIDQAVKDDRLTEEQAKDLKAELEDAVLPGYAGGMRMGFGGRGGHMRGGGFGGGFGMGPGMGFGAKAGGAMAPAGFHL